MHNENPSHLKITNLLQLIVKSNPNRNHPHFETISCNPLSSLIPSFVILYIKLSPPLHPQGA